MIRNKSLVKVIGDWNITKWGLEHGGFPPYEIHRSRLWEDWNSHMSEKNWVNIEIFKTALSEAQKTHGGKKNVRL